MLMAAARLRDESAILLVVQEAIRQGSLEIPGVKFVYKSFFPAIVEKKHPKALYLQAQICELRKDYGKALQLYEILVQGNGQNPEVGKNDINYGDVWIAISRLNALKADRTGMEAAISIAALQHDHPKAYYSLAKAFTDPSSVEYETFMLKAAASGEFKSAH